MRTRREGLTWLPHSSNLKPMNSAEGKDVSWKPIAVEQKEIDEYPEKLLLWEKNNSYIKSLMGLLLPNSLLIKPFREETTKGIWDFLVDEFKGCLHIVALELRCKL